MMAIFSRYSRVIEADGSSMQVRTALALINQALAEFLSEQEGEFNASTRWALAWSMRASSTPVRATCACCVERNWMRPGPPPTTTACPSEVTQHLMCQILRVYARKLTDEIGPNTREDIDRYIRLDLHRHYMVPIEQLSPSPQR